MPIDADRVSWVVNHGPSNFSVCSSQSLPWTSRWHVRIGGVPGGSPGSSSNMAVVGHAIGVCVTAQEGRCQCHRRRLFGAAMGT